MKPAHFTSYFFVAIAALSMLTVCCVIGCDENKNKVSARVKGYSSSEGASEPIFDETENTVTLNHDFGVLVQPIEETSTHEFEITNNSGFEWTLKQIVNTCSCTIADMTSNKIQPGKTEKVLVAYKPVGAGSFDDNRKSLVNFEEAQAPRFILAVGSRVREPLTVRPKSLAWTRVGENQTKKDSFEIQNFSGENWKNLAVTSQPEWLHVTLTSVRVPESEPVMKQLWLADTTAKTEGLPPGEHRGEIVLQAKGEKDKEFTQKCPVVLQITSAVSAVPAQFFFGNVKTNETATKTIKVIFSPDAIPSDKGEIQFEHNLGEALKLAWLKSEGETWELQATLSVETARIPDEPKIVMVFSDTTLPKIQLPIYVMMDTEGRQ